LIRFPDLSFPLQVGSLRYLFTTRLPCQLLGTEEPQAMQAK
jgi:hypothetical protein